VLQWGLDFAFALAGSVLLSAAILILGRWRSAAPTPAGVPS
jgi:hypothetical protein